MMQGVVTSVYYFETPLSDEDLDWVQQITGLEGPCRQTRIPHVLPAEIAGLDEQAFVRHEFLLRAALRNAGIVGDRGTQVILVALRQLYWNSVLLHAVHAETGMFPLLVQTREQREAIGNPGEIRILDMDGAMAGFKSRGV